MSGFVSVTTITSTPSGSSLDVGNTVTFALSTSAAVQVTPASGGGQPALTLNNGGLAGYAGTDANGILLFSYTVAAGESTPDLTVTGLSLNGATITSIGSTSLQPPIAYDVGSNPQGLAATADLNGDGQPDLAVTNVNTGTVAVLPGDGTGSFGAPNTYASGQGSDRVAAANLDGDGRAALVALNGGSTAAVSILLDNGAGGFGLPTTYAIGADPFALTSRPEWGRRG